MNNFDMNKLMSMISKMDKKDLEKGMAQVSQMLNTKDKDEILKKLNNQMNGRRKKLDISRHLVYKEGGR